MTHISHVHRPRYRFHISYCFRVIEDGIIPKNFWSGTYINVVIYAEVSIGFARIEEVEAALPLDQFRRLPVPWEAGFLAGKAFVTYRQRGGTRTLPLPDFFIGAHALVAELALLTRDPRRVRTYFPQVHLLTPPPP